MFYRIFTLIFLLVCLSNNANALDSCKGKRVFSCSSLPSNTAAKKKCYLYYQCKNSPTGESCFQCRLAIKPLIKGLCEENSKAQCLKKET